MTISIQTSWKSPGPPVRPKTRGRSTSFTSFCVELLKRQKVSQMTIVANMWIHSKLLLYYKTYCMCFCRTCIFVLYLLMLLALKSITRFNLYFPLHSGPAFRNCWSVPLSQRRLHPCHWSERCRQLHPDHGLHGYNGLHPRGVAM